MKVGTATAAFQRQRSLLLIIQFTQQFGTFKRCIGAGVAGCKAAKVVLGTILAGIRVLGVLPGTSAAGTSAKVADAAIHVGAECLNIVFAAPWSKIALGNKYHLFAPASVSIISYMEIHIIIIHDFSSLNL